MQATKPSDRVIVLTRTFAASPHAVFNSLTQPDHLLLWMKPANMSLVTCEVDLRVGGNFRYVFEPARGIKLEVRGDYQSIDPPHEFAYTESYDFSPLKLLVTTTLSEVNGQTAFTQTIEYPSKQERDDDFDGVVTSATEAYANLERHLQSSP